ATRLDGQHRVNLRVEVMLGEGVNQRGEADLVFEQRGDVVKKNAFLGEVGYFADQLFEMITVGATRGLHWLPCSFDPKRCKTIDQLGRRFLDLVNARGTRASAQLGT